MDSVKAKGAKVGQHLGRAMALAFSLWASPLLAGSPAPFLSGFEDLPLMSALRPEPEAMTVFDSPFGRVVENYASGPTSAGTVAQFYRESLPQLGWAAEMSAPNKMVFHREGEDLLMEFTESGSAVTVRFQLSPTAP